MAPNLLTSRLRELADAEMIERVEPGAAVEYQRTDQGLSIRGVVASRPGSSPGRQPAHRRAPVTNRA